LADNYFRSFLNIFAKQVLYFFIAALAQSMFSRQKANTTLSKIKHLPSAKDGNPNYNNQVT